jgi:hypothetical protein
MVSICALGQHFQAAAVGKIQFANIGKSAFGGSKRRSHSYLVTNTLKGLNLLLLGSPGCVFSLHLS